MNYIIMPTIVGDTFIYCLQKAQKLSKENNNIEVRFEFNDENIKICDYDNLSIKLLNRQNYFFDQQEAKK